MADGFQLLTLLGTGTFGEAWIAKSRKHDSKCVVKVVNILRLSERELDQSLTEVSVLGRMHHSNIVRYLDAYVHDGTLNIAMEYADGGDLHKKICDQKGVTFTREVILDWFVQICLALQYIHRHNILHRDLKSQNIFLTSKSIIKVGDFGIARILKDSSDLAVTTIGTPFYLSPEICQKKPYNHKSDMWALGCVLYEICCLHVPFDADDLQELMMKILQENYRPIPRSLGSTISVLVKRLLDKNPENRPSSDYILSLSALKPYIKKHESKDSHLQLKERRYSLPNVSTRHQKEGKGRKCIVVSADKENLDPKLAGRTYLVKNPKFKQLSKSPNVSHIVAKQRREYSVHTDMVTQEEQEKSISKADLFSRVQRNSSNSLSKSPPINQRKWNTKGDSQTGDNGRENSQASDGIPRQRLDKRDLQDGRSRPCIESNEKGNKPPSGRKSLDSKPQCLFAFQKEGNSQLDRHVAETVQGKRDLMPGKMAENKSGGLKRVNSERRSNYKHSNEGNPRPKVPSVPARTSEKRPKPVGSESTGVLKKPSSRHYYPLGQTTNEEFDHSELENEVFFDQKSESEIRECHDDPITDKFDKVERIRRSSSYDCVFEDKQQTPSDGYIPRALSTGSIMSRRLSKDGCTYKVSSSAMPAEFKDAEEQRVLIKQDPVDTTSLLYNAVCRFKSNRSSGLDTLYVGITRALGKREADMYINKITESMIQQREFCEVELIIPENKRGFLPLILCYIQMS